MEFIDTHIHIEDDRFNKDRALVCEQAQQKGVKYLINAGSSVDANNKILELLPQIAYLYTGLGLHPHEFSELNLDMIYNLTKYLSQEKVVAVGEIGLDYHEFPDYPLPNKKAQQEAFKQQLKLVRIFELPVIIHVREAWQDVFNLLADAGSLPAGGVMHCYSGGLEHLEKVLAAGFYIGIGGPITYPKSDNMRLAVEKIPKERLLLETDGPYLPPQSKRGKRNEPANLIEIAEAISKQKSSSLLDIASYTTQNAYELFKIGFLDNKNIVYKIKNSLYVNLTNRCSSNCAFCPRQKHKLVQGYDLTLSREPLASEIISAIGDAKQYKEIVFCGYGEPLLRLNTLLTVAKAVKQQGGRVRINSNGQADVIYNFDIIPQGNDLIDEWSISLNTTEEEQYNNLMKPTAGAGTFLAVKNFITRLVAAKHKVTITAVEFPYIDSKKLEQLANKLGVSYRGRVPAKLGEPEE